MINRGTIINSSRNSFENVWEQNSEKKIIGRTFVEISLENTLGNHLHLGNPWMNCLRHFEEKVESIPNRINTEVLPNRTEISQDIS